MLGRGATAAGLLTTWLLFAASPAWGSDLPTMFSTDRCVNDCQHVVPVYQVRPRMVGCQEELGGELTLKWSSWAATKAVGAGTSMEMFMGHVFRARVNVVASAPAGGHFTRLSITFTPARPAVALKVLRNANGMPFLWGAEL